MFDDQLAKGPNPPGNLPIGEPASQGFQRGEPDDILGEVEKSAPSALEVGVLRPKQESPRTTTVPPIPPTRDVNSGVGRPDIYTVKEPVLARGLITVLAILIILGVLGGGGWWIYNKFVKQGGDTAVNVVEPAEETLLIEEPILAPGESPPATTEATTSAVEGGPVENVATQDIGAEVKDQQALFGEPIDKDADGLDDTKETELGTDPNNWDSDGDELSDGDEALVWKTDPLNPDTDGDKFLDGTEVKAGYNPNGPGKIFEPPKS